MDQTINPPNEMPDLLQTIKDQVAEEYECADWHEFVFECHHEKVQNGWDEVCKRYAIEVAKASLNKAAENAKLEVIELPNNRFMHRVVKSRITSESNIVL